MRPATGPIAEFESVLFEHGEECGRAEHLGEPDIFGDLNLDQVLEAMTAGREAYSLKPFFYAPLHEVDAVQYRHEVFRDLEKSDVREAITKFAAAMRQMREHLEQVQKLHYGLQKRAWFLDAVEIYCGAVQALASELADRDISSRALRAFRAYVLDYTASEGFTSLADEAQRLREKFASIRYTVRSNGPKITVGLYQGEGDYSAEVEQTFSKFKQGDVKGYLVRLPDYVEMNHVEERILGLVARLNPDVFGALASFCTRHTDYVDGAIVRFDREVQFYLAYLELIARLRAAGLPFCYPHVSARSKTIAVEDGFDLALAGKLVPGGGTVVGNDFQLDDDERIFVVTGPNNGGKTTFARMFGQLHYLASLGLLVPGRNARLFLPDRIYTHFEKEEDIETLRGKFEDELVRVHDILERATAASVIVMNESFSSTTLNDALYVGTEVMQRLLDRDCLGVYVTFVDEIASLSEATVSIVSQIVPENPAERTFKLVRKRADGLAYAWAIAEKYGLTYDRLMARVG
jgi:DNA mismatch repair protein MutS